MNSGSRILVLGVVVLVVCWAIFAVAADGTPGLVRLEGKDLTAARAAKAAHHGQPGSGQITELAQPVTLREKAARAAGTIQYDTGSFGAYSTTPWNSFGNRFNSALNTAGTAISPVQLSGSLTYCTFGIQSVNGANTWGPIWITLYDQLNTALATAQAVSTAGFTWPGGPHTGPYLLGVGLGPWNYSGSSFLLGMLDANNNATLPNGVAALIGGATTGGQGFHGYSMVWNTVTGTGYLALGANNVLMRASGNVIVPVELMGFTVE